MKKKEAPVTCPECGREMTRRGFRYAHVRNAHGANYFDFMIEHGEHMDEGTHYAVCEICKEKCARLTGGHLEKEHGLTAAKYLKQFPGSRLHCDEFSRKQKLIKEKQYREDPTLKDKAGRRSYRSQLWQELRVPEPEDKEDYRSRPMSDSIFAYEPSIEQSVILLFGQLCAKYNIVVEEFWSNRFPDCRAVIRSRKRRDKYIPIYIEFETKSSNISRHPELRDGTWRDRSPLILVCWEHDWKEIPRDIIVVELREELKKLRKKRS